MKPSAFVVVSTRIDIPRKLRERPFRSAEALRCGITRKQLSSSTFRQIFRDVYVYAEIPDSLELRCRAASRLFRVPAIFCGLTAARLCGLPVPAEDERIHVAVPSRTPTPLRIRGMAIHEYDIPRQQVWVFRDFAMVRPERLFLELAALLPRLDLIIAGDQMLRAELATIVSIEAFLRRCYRRRGVRKARAACPLLEKKADSPGETRLRMLIVDAGLPRPVANRDIFDSLTGAWLARPDLSYPDLKIAIQYEGRHHQEDRVQYVYDTERDARIELEGWIVIRVPAETLFRHPPAIVDKVRRAISLRHNP